MNNIEKAIELFTTQHFHCSQAVFGAFANQLGITEEQALKIGGCFGAGMNKGEVCGCVTGALMALGLKYGQCKIEDLESRNKEYDVCCEFYEKFINANGSCICRDLLGYDFGNPNDLKILKEQKPYLEICPKLVKSAAEILTEYID